MSSVLLTKLNEIKELLKCSIAVQLKLAEFITALHFIQMQLLADINKKQQRNTFDLPKIISIPKSEGDE